MKPLQLCALALLLAGCARRQAPPVVAAAPRPTETPTATPTIAPTAPPIKPKFVPPVTPTPPHGGLSDAEWQVVVSGIARLENASPERDFETAWAAKDYRFIGLGGNSTVGGVGGNATYVPDLSWGKDKMLGFLKIYGVNVIEGTSDSDVIATFEQAKLQELAGRYANKYNRLLLARLDARTAEGAPENGAR